MLSVLRILSVVLLLFVAFLLSNQSQLKRAIRPGTAVRAAERQQVPPPPSERADRFGAYNWAIDYGAYPGDAGGTNDRLNWGANQVATIGSRIIRVWLGARDIYYLPASLPAQPYDLVRDAASPAYDKLFRDPRFRTYLLTTFSFADLNGNWPDGYTTAEYQAERDEIRRLGESLIGNPNYAGKTFIILNWEGDNALSRLTNKQSAWDAYTQWIQSRADGVDDARKANPANASRLFSGLEFNRVRGDSGQPCGTPVSDPVKEDPLKNRCVIDYIAPRVKVDYYSYSAYQSLYPKVVNPSLNLRTEFNQAMNFALAQVRTLRPEIGENNFIIGEFGFPRTDFGECSAAESLRETLDGIAASDSFKVSYVVLWQIVDNGLIWDSDGWPGFGMYRHRNGQLEQTMNGKTFQAFLANQSFTVPSDCPRVRRTPVAGILETINGSLDFRLYPDNVMAIYVQGCCQNTASPFSASGNTVRFRQGYRESLLPRDNAQFFYESITQVNASMPSARQPGQALVFVTDQRGIDSNGQYLDLKCDACPRITDPYGVLDAATLMESYIPGSGILTIQGERFSSSGNTVIIEQLDNQQVTHTYTLLRDNAWSESPVQLTARLPQELIIDRFAWVYVRDAQGRKSNLMRILTNGACQNCGPGIRPVLGVVNRFTQIQDFHPGTSVEIRGAGFSTAGNQVIVAQHSQRDALPRSSIVSESSTKIAASLPATLLPGYAIVYVIDATGRETGARELTITSTPVTTVSAASYNASALAAEAIVAAFGTNLAVSTAAATSTPLPTSLANTSIIIKDSAGTERPAPLFFVSPTQINYLVPQATAPGLATVTITGGDGSVSIGTAQITAVAPGLFTVEATGQGIAAAVAIRVKADGSQIYEPIAQFNPALNKFTALPIDLGPDLGSQTDQVFLALFGTGIRFRSALSNVMAKVGGLDATVSFAGAQGELVGLDQINLRLPRALIGRGGADVAVTIDGKVANTVRVSIR